MLGQAPATSWLPQLGDASNVTACEVLGEPVLTFISANGAVDAIAPAGRIVSDTCGVASGHGVAPQPAIAELAPVTSTTVPPIVTTVGAPEVLAGGV